MADDSQEGMKQITMSMPVIIIIAFVILVVGFFILNAMTGGGILRFLCSSVLFWMPVGLPPGFCNAIPA
jgi:hypothetical protein